MWIDEVRPEHQVTHIRRWQGSHLIGAVQGHHGRHAREARTDAADPLGDVLGILRGRFTRMFSKPRNKVPAAWAYHYLLNAFDGVHLNLDLQMTLNSRDRSITAVIATCNPPGEARVRELIGPHRFP